MVGACLPWVVGIRGMIDPLHIESLSKFLDIRRKHWRTVIELTVLPSVRALYFLHIVRFGGLSGAISPDLDSENSAAVSHTREAAVGTKRKPHRHDTACWGINPRKSQLKVVAFANRGSRKIKTHQQEITFPSSMVNSPSLIGAISMCPTRLLLPNQ